MTTDFRAIAKRRVAFNSIERRRSGAESPVMALTNETSQRAGLFGPNGVAVVENRRGFLAMQERRCLNYAKIGGKTHVGIPVGLRIGVVNFRRSSAAPRARVSSQR